MLVAPLFQHGEQVVYLLKISIHLGPGFEDIPSDAKVLLHGQAAENQPSFRRLADSMLGDDIGLLVADFFPFKEDLTGSSFCHPGNGVHGSGLSSAVGAQDNHNLALRNIQGNSF